DDVLGVFGDEKKLGKPVGSDIIENKQTLLVLKALEKGNSEQRKVVKNLLGKKDLNLKELEKFRKIIVETGALDYSNKLAENFSKKAFGVLNKVQSNSKVAKDFLIKIAEYISIRNH
ncbi:polyprenyl synthetase family protein, partial [bacterium]|nr:polyprenyl synthetase family protein [bacterium]